MKFIKTIKAILFPTFERKWCIVTDYIKDDWEWKPLECLFRNGKLDIRHCRYKAIVCDKNTFDRALELSRLFNEVYHKYYN